MAKTGTYRLDPKTGKFVPGHVKPWLPPEHMRVLPSALITKDPSNADSVHELDAPHVVDDLIDIYQERQHGKDPLAERKLGPVAAVDVPIEAEPANTIPRTEVVPVNQERVDIVRMRVMSALVQQGIWDVENGMPWVPTIQHLWFPADNVNEYELKPGAGPPRQERPRHLRDIDLELDFFSWPKSAAAKANAAGRELPDFKKMYAHIEAKARIGREILLVDQREARRWE